MRKSTLNTATLPRIHDLAKQIADEIAHSALFSLALTPGEVLDRIATLTC